MRKLVGAVAVIAALTACSSTTTVIHAPAPKTTPARASTAKPAPAAVRSEQPKPTVTKTITHTPTAVPATPTPAASTPAPAAATPTADTGAGYLGDIFGGGTGNPCNFASGYQLGVCNPTGETEQQYVENPGGPAPGTSTNAQGCYYVRMDEGYCPSTNTYIPMQDPNG
jgi:outer membrane biosynthesis protein TonB